MPALSSNQRAILTARFGVMRFGAFRFGFAPKDTRGTTPGSAGPFVFWSRVYPTAVVWAAVKR